MSQELNVALVQSNLIWENPKQNRADFSKKIAFFPENIDLIILPEMFTTGFTMHPSNISNEEGVVTLQWMQELAKKYNTAITGSIPFFEERNYYNRLFFVKPNGDYETYNKRHTFTLAGEDKIYTAGQNRLIVTYKGFRICPLVCYDLRFPVWARNTENYDVLLYIANWPKPRIDAWDVLLKARAIENMTYCIGVNRVGLDAGGYEYPGHSAAYNALGENLVFSAKETALFATLTKEHLTSTRNKLKFLEDQDHFTL